LQIGASKEIGAGKRERGKIIIKEDLTGVAGFSLKNDVSLQFM